MRPRRPALRWPRLSAAVMAAGTVAMAGMVGWQPSASAQPARADTLTAQSVAVSVVSVSPSTLIPSPTPTMLTVVLSLTNTSSQTLTDLAVKGARSNPISTRSALDAAIAKVQPPDQNQAADFNPTKPVTLTLGPGQSVQVPFVAQTSTDASTNPGLCVCNDLIYPLYFTVTAFDNSSAALVVGSAQTYVVAFSTSKPAPVQVAWVWPLIDRPHRLIGDTAFLDDALATSVSSAGRLDRMLQVVEAVASRSIAMTLVIDPELIGELSTMASGYSVQQRGKPVAGTGGGAAVAWLDRLRAVLALDSKLEVDLTPLADPDVESLTRNGLSWTSLNPQVSSQISVALGGHAVGTNLAWPADQTVSSDTLSRLVSQGNTAVILDDRTLRPSAGINTPANQLGVVQTPSGQITAHVTAAGIQRWVAPVLTNGGPGLSQLPQLVSEVSIDAVAASQQTPSQTSRYVCIVAPRMLNPAPDAAAAAIIATAETYWSQAITIGAASTSVPPADHGQLIPPDASAGGLPPETIAAAQAASDAARALNTMFTSVDATTILGAFPVAVQRSESTAWRYEPDGPQGGIAFARQLTDQVDAIESGVELVKPTTGTYTLASSNSPLPVTIINHLNVQVTVRISVTTKNGLPGFTAPDSGPRTIAAGNRVIAQIPTHVDRAGRFKVEVALLTPSGAQIDQPLELSVRSTALGAIGVIITVVAAVVLALALLIRLARRLRNGPTPRDPELAVLK